MAKDYRHLFEERVSKDSYENAKMAALDHKAISPEAIALREDLLPELQKARRASQKGRSRAPSASARVGQENALDALLADLIKGTVNTEAHGFVYRAYDKDELGKGRTRASYRHFKWIVQ